MKTSIPEIQFFFRASTSRSIAILLCLMNLISGAKAQSHVISPMTYNYFQGVQEFPDSMVRVFMTNKETKPWQWDFARQALVGSDLKGTEIRGFTSSSGASFNIPAEKIHVLHTPKGHTVLGIDQFHCDIDIASVLIFISDSGYVLKEVTIDPNEGWGKIQQIGFARHDLMGVVLDGFTYFFDLDGNRVDHTEPETIYSQLIPFGDSFIGIDDDKIHKLDSNMSTVEFESVSNSVLQAYVFNEDRILVLTSKEVLIYNDQLELRHSSIELDSISVAKEINDRIWVGGQVGLYELDTLLNVKQFYPDSPSEEIVWLGDWRDSLLIIGQYDGLDHTEVSLKKFAPQDIISLASPDIAITQIVIPPDQRKVRIFYCPTDPGIHFDSLVITVVNLSQEVVNEFKIGCDFGGPGQCRSFQKVWFVDTVSLQPQQSINIIIDSFTMYCVFPANFCAWTFSPNDLPDANPINDKFCETIRVLNTNAPIENRLINATYFDTYSSHQILPDGRIRFFFHSNYRYPENTYADLLPGQSLSEMQPQTVYVPASDYWNWSSDGLLSLPFADGSTLLLNTTYPCDVAVPGALVKINKDGEIDWFRDIDDVLYFYRAAEMMFIDSNRIGIKQDKNDGKMLIIDTEGNVISFEDGDFPYANTIEIPSGYLVSEDKQLFILNTGFDVVSANTLVGNITEIWPQQGDEFIIKAGEKFYLLDSLLHLEILALGNAHYDVVWKSKDWYWAADRQTRHVDKFFPGFPLYLYRDLLPPGVDPIFGVTSGYNVFVLTEYLNTISKGLLIYTGGSDNIHFRLQEDIEIAHISIPDSVPVDYINDGIFGGGWYHYYDYVDVEVFNSGFDTIHKFYIQDPSVEECFMCYRYYNIWTIDSIDLPPGENATIKLGSFHPECQYHNPGELCLHAFGPNDKADRNYHNDKFCEPYSLLIGTSSPNATSAFTIFPNPATDRIYFDLSERALNELTCTIYDMSGNIADQFTIREFSFSIQDYIPGVYFVLLNDSSGNRVAHQFISKI